ncbi:MAG: hypothetical protein ACREOH_02710, partial [Candidatus Entotheonellia bacterium]
TAVWAPAIQQSGGNPTVNQYVDTLVTELTAGASPLLSRQVAGVATGAAGAGSDSYCLAAFQQVPNAQPNSAAHLATAFYNRMNALNLAHTDAAFSQAVVRINCSHRFPLHDWAYYPRAIEHYFQYCMDPKHVPIHLFPTERHAAVLEGFLAGNDLFRDPIATMTLPGKGPLRVRCLDISVARHLVDIEAFSHFTYAYAFGLMPLEEGKEVGEAARYYIEIADALQGQRRIDLGPVWDTGGLLQAIRGEEEIKQRVRATIRGRWQKHQDELRKQSEWKETLRTELRSRAAALLFPAVPAGQVDGIERDDLKLAMQAVLYKLVSEIATT